MAISSGGLFGSHKGKLGKLVSYKILDKDVVRTVGEMPDNPPSEKQLPIRQGTAIVTAFLKPILPFIRIGFQLAPERFKMYAYNRATSILKKTALIGAYPNISIDYSKVLVAEGDLNPAENAVVEKVEGGLKFTWDKSTAWPEHTEQVMMMAYFPELQEAIFITSGARRSKGEDILEIKPSRIDAKMETYIAFIADDRSSVATSTYTGEIN